MDKAVRGVELSEFFPERLRRDWQDCGLDMERVREIRIRCGVAVRALAETEIRFPFVYGEREIEDIFKYLCNDSVYAYDDERRQGYLAVEGGHRIGITGEITRVGGGYITKHIRYMNIRVAHEKRGLSEAVAPFIRGHGGQLLNTLIISPPGIGKTTLLRDIVRVVSDGEEGFEGCNVGVVDERGELAGAYRGRASLDLGGRTDVVSGGDKAHGIGVLVRAFAPRVVAIDEIGTENDARAILHAGVSGCAVIATAHGGSVIDAAGNSEIGELLRLKVFDRLIVLSQNCAGKRRFEVFDGEGGELCGSGLLREL